MAQTSDTSLGDRIDRIWSVADLELLHEVEKPIIVVVTSTHDDPSRSVLAVRRKLTGWLAIVAPTDVGLAVLEGSGQQLMCRSRTLRV